MKAIVVAMDRNRGIGANNDLLWQRDLPDDMRHYKDLTTGGTIIMGRKTYESIGKALPNRQNIVVTSKPFEAENILCVSSLDEAYKKAKLGIFVIGGGEIYKAAIDDMDVLHVTDVDAEFPQASVFFPPIDISKWRETSREHHSANAYNKYDFDFVTYKKSNSA